MVDTRTRDNLRRPDPPAHAASTRRSHMLGPLHCRTYAAALAVVVAAPGLTGCAADVDPRPSQAQGAAEEVVLGHVHGLGVDPGDGTLYVASHVGVFRMGDDGSFERVADRWQDTMGFAVAGPSHFLGSGHPDPRDDLPASLGLLESTDGAETWDTVSLVGEADLHAIEPIGDRIYAFDSISGSLITTTDRTTWTTISTRPIYDLAVDPANPGTVYATTDRGVLVRSVNGQGPRAVLGAPTLTAIDWEPGGELVGVAADGSVMSSPDASRWKEVGRLDGPAEALDVVEGTWHAATGSGVYRSTDDGQTWEALILHDS